MKTFLTIIIIMLAASFCEAQWQPDTRLTNNPVGSNTSYTNAWCIASSGDSVHAVWKGFQDGNREIYYRRSLNGGAAWQTLVRLTNDAAISEYPAISVSGQAIHVVWVDERSGNKEIYYKRSTNGGANWQADTRLTNDAGISEFPSLCVSGQLLHLVWVDQRMGNKEIYYKRSSNAGVNWTTTDRRLTANDSLSEYPSVSVSGQFIHLSWQDKRNGNYEIFYKGSPDGGLSWLSDIRLTNNPANSQAPTIAGSGNTVHIAWSEDRDGNYEKYYKRSTDAGVSWSADTRLTNNLAISGNPSITALGQVVHLVWIDTRDADAEIYYKRSINGGASWEPDTRLTNANDESSLASVSVSGSAVHVIWQDYRFGHFEVFYKRNPAGGLVAVSNAGSEIPAGYSLEQNYPNPFNPVTNFEFRIADFGFVSLKVYDAGGREINTLVNVNLKPGTYKVVFDGTELPSGTYFYKLETDKFTDVKKMILVK